MDKRLALRQPIDDRAIWAVIAITCVDKGLKLLLEFLQFSQLGVDVIKLVQCDLFHLSAWPVFIFIEFKQFPAFLNRKIEPARGAHKF